MKVDIEKVTGAFKEKNVRGMVEYIGGCVGLLLVVTLSINIVKWLLRIFINIPLIGKLAILLIRLLYLISIVTIWATLIISIIELIGLIYVMATDEGVDKKGYILASVTTGLVLLASILYVMHSVTAVQIIFGIAAFLLGIDLFVKTWIDDVGFNGKYDLGTDFIKIKSVIKEIKAQSDMEKSLKQASMPQGANNNSQENRFENNVHVEKIEPETIVTPVAVRGSMAGDDAEPVIGNTIQNEQINQGRENYQSDQNYVNYNLQETSAAETPAATTPAATTPAVETPAATTPAAVIPAAVIPVATASASDNGGSNDSYFDGTGIQFIGMFLLTILVSVITCSIATPWMLVEILKWRTSHTVIGGKRQCFNGTGGQLIGYWFKWVILSLITCGIYTFLQVPQTDYRKWVANHTSYIGCPVDGAGFYIDSFYTGTVGEYLGTAILSGILTTITCGIAYPWAETMVQRYVTKNTVINTDRYVYTGTGGGLFGIYILNGLLSIITCGIYTPWAVCALNRYIISHTLIESSGNRRLTK